MTVQLINNPYNKHFSNNQGGFLEPFPVGFTLFWGGETPPDKGITALGQLLNRTEYPELYHFAKENNLLKPETEWQEQQLYGFYSDGDGETTFRVPNYTGYKFIGYDESAHTLGKTLEPALPNITGTFHSATAYFSGTGAFRVWNINANQTSAYGTNVAGQTFEASRCSSLYKDDCSTVQTPDIPQNVVIKYKS